MDVLASHSVLLNKIYKNETMPTEVSTVFPIKTVEELEKLNNGISEEDIPFYVRVFSSFYRNPYNYNLILLGCNC